MDNDLAQPGTGGYGAPAVRLSTLNRRLSRTAVIVGSATFLAPPFEGAAMAPAVSHRGALQ